MNTPSRRTALVFLFSLFLSAAASAQQIKDLIKPVRLSPGRTDTLLLSDVFYSEKYDASFLPNKNLNVSFDSRTLKLVLSLKNGFSGITPLNFKLNGQTLSIPVISQSLSTSGDRLKHTFIYKSETKPARVGITGSFNNWNKNSHQLKFNPAAGYYELEMQLEPGTYAYKFIVDGKEVLDPANSERVPTGFDDYNSVITVSEIEKDKRFLHSLKTSEAGNTVTLSFFYERNNKEGKLRRNEVFALLDNQTINPENIKVKGGKAEITLKKELLKGMKHVRAAVIQDGRISNMQDVLLDGGHPAGNTTPFVWNDGIIYSIMTDRFNDGDKTINNPVVHDSLFVQANYQGGDFQGIINKLNDGYFDRLGINTLWISPAYDNPDSAFRENPKPYRWYTGYHGYWPVNETGVEEKFGSMEKLKELVSAAHRRNIKVLLDIVAHHVHIDNPLFREHPDWFGKLDLPDGRKNLRFWDEFRLTTWFEPYMPSFDYQSSQQAIDYMTENCIWWLKQTGADGFRHDAVKHVPNEFWRALTKRLNSEINSERSLKAYQIGETFGDYNLVNSYVNNGQLDAQFNFNLSYFAVPVFAEDDKSFLVIDHQLKRTFETFGYNNVMGNIMDSHDKVRFMAYADGDIQKQGVDTRDLAWNNPPVVDDPDSYKKAELCFTYLMTIPGLPVVYYGSEFGMTGADDPDNRRMMRFGNDLSEPEKQMLQQTGRLISLRRQHPALRYGDFLTLKVDNTSYAYLRGDMNEKIVVVMNKKKEDAVVEISLPSLYKNARLTDLNGGQTISATDGRVTLKVPAIGSMLYKLSF